MVKGMASCVAAGALYSRCHNHPTRHSTSSVGVGNVEEPLVSFACGSLKYRSGEKREWTLRLPTCIELVGCIISAVGNVGMKPLVSISCRSLEVPQVKVGQVGRLSADAG